MRPDHQKHMAEDPGTREAENVCRNYEESGEPGAAALPSSPYGRVKVAGNRRHRPRPAVEAPFFDCDQESSRPSSGERERTAWAADRDSRSAQESGRHRLSGKRAARRARGQVFTLGPTSTSSSRPCDDFADRYG